MHSTSMLLSCIPTVTICVVLLGDIDDMLESLSVIDQNSDGTPDDAMFQDARG